MKKGIKIIIVVLITFILIGVVVFIKLNENNNTIKPSPIDKSFIELKGTSELEDKFDYHNPYKVYKTYNELINDFEKSNIKESDFTNNNILVIQVDYNPCSEEYINPVGHKINGDNIKINFEYKAVCGGCAPDYLYYALKVDKDIIDPKVTVSSKRINDPKCDPNVSYKPMIYL